MPSPSLTPQPPCSGAVRSTPDRSGGTDGQELLAEQLHTLTRVVETITYRLLELEERLAEQETLLQEMEQQAGGLHQLSDGAERQVNDTEERLARLELLLTGEDPAVSAAASRHLQPVAGGNQASAGPEPQDCIDGPFLEEPEQPFMDDLSLSEEEVGLEHLSA